jgi:hypothetical protein
MTECLLFEHTRRGRSEMVRAIVSEYRGARFLDLRKWVDSTEGPKATRQGCTVPIERIGELGAALVAFAKEFDSSEPEIES